MDWVQQPDFEADQRGPRSNVINSENDVNDNNDDNDDNDENGETEDDTLATGGGTKFLFETVSSFEESR